MTKAVMFNGQKLTKVQLILSSKTQNLWRICNHSQQYKHIKDKFQVWK